ncbi:hypothetical protein H920_17352 [Fukomys damarensis]|uniref:Uncharacterized protein n=1 Tax=Fukomys damarensis TaxID=885580 RepID=A0A091CQ99_FUKDA|nr:hypothetical protein H920_17352 [Fukomys damarensis]
MQKLLDFSSLSNLQVMQPTISKRYLELSDSFRYALIFNKFRQVYLEDETSLTTATGFPGDCEGFKFNRMWKECFKAPVD